MASPMFGETSKRSRRLSIGILAFVACLPLIFASMLYCQHRVKVHAIDLVHDLVADRQDLVRVDPHVIADWSTARRQYGMPIWEGVDDIDTDCDLPWPPCFISVMTRRGNVEGFDT